MILKETGDINIELIDTGISFLFFAIYEQVMIELTSVNILDKKNNALIQRLS